MATLKNIEITKNYAIRPTGNVNIAHCVWCVKGGEEYTLVKFSIEEIDGYLWVDSLCVPCSWGKRKIIKLTKEYCEKYITQEDIREYKSFLEDGEKWGWD